MATKVASTRGVPDAAALASILGVQDFSISGVTFASAFQPIPSLEAKVMSLEMLSNMGVQDSFLQTELCKEIAPVLLTRAAQFKEAEVYFADNAFLGGDAPNTDDGKAFVGIHALLALLIPANRPIGNLESTCPSLRKWFMRCRSHYAEKLPDVHCIGTSRIGSQIDRRPESLRAAAACERALALNVGQKKAKSQRDKEKAKKAKAAKAGKKTSPAPATEPAAAAVAPLTLDGSAGRERVWKRLEQAGIKPYKEIAPKLDAERPVGHSTHNLFLKAKKSKKKSFLVMVCARQAAKIDLKALAKELKVKSLRMAKDTSCMCLEEGCITPLQLYNDVAAQCQLIMDEELLKMSSLRICAGCKDPSDHSQHNVVDISPGELVKMVKESGHDIKEMQFADK